MEQTQNKEFESQEKVLRGINNPALLELLNKINNAIFELKNEREKIATDSKDGFLASYSLFAPFFPSKAKVYNYSELKQIDKKIEKLEKLHDELLGQYDTQQQRGTDDDDKEKEDVEDDDEKEFEYEPWD